MKIFIDSIGQTIYEWEDGENVRELLTRDRRYPHVFQQIVDNILTPSQSDRYAGGDSDIVYKLSKKKQKILASYINKPT
jgi:hypothetical protein